MSFGNKQPQTKTQYETENQQIGREAFTKMGDALNRYGDMASNPDTYRKNLLNDYYNSDNSALWSDAQRATRRNLMDATANNYAATHGGYSSAGNKYYDDVTRRMNDYNARLWDYGVNTVNNMYDSDLTNARKYYGDLGSTHDLARTGDAIDAYNDVIKQSNKNAWTGMLSNAGKVVSAIPTPWTRAIGAGMMVAGNAFSKDYSDSLARLQNEISPSQAGALGYINQFQNPATNFSGQLAQIADVYRGSGDFDRLKNWWKNRKGTVTGTTPQVQSNDSLVDKDWWQAERAKHGL